MGGRGSGRTRRRRWAVALELEPLGSRRGAGTVCPGSSWASIQGVRAWGSGVRWRLAWERMLGLTRRAAGGGRALRPRHRATSRGNELTLAHGNVARRPRSDRPGPAGCSCDGWAYYCGSRRAMPRQREFQAHIEGTVYYRNFFGPVWWALLQTRAHRRAVALSVRLPRSG